MRLDNELLKYDTKSIFTKEKIDEMDFIKIKKLYCAIKKIKLKVNLQNRRKYLKIIQLFSDSI